MSKLALQVMFALIFCIAAGNCNSLYLPPAGSCYSNHYQFLIQRGESKQLPGLCMLAKCLDNGKTAYVSCPDLVLDSLCTPRFGDRNLNLAYPECCRPSIMCV